MKRFECAVGIICFAVAAHGQTTADTAWEVLTAGLKDKNAEKRKEAVTAVGTIGKQARAVKIEEDMLAGDPDVEVRQAAAGMLGEMKSTASIPKLKAALDKGDEVSFSAARALWMIGDRSGRPMLEDVADSEYKNSPGPVESAKRQARKTLHDPSAMAKMGSTEAADMLLGPFAIGLKLAVELRKDGGAPGRLVSINLLAQDCAPSSVKVMESVMSADKNDAVRAAAVLGLGKCGSAASVPKLQSLLTFEKYSITLVAAASIVRIETEVK